MSINNLCKHQENNSNNSNRSNSYVDDTGRVIDRKWEVRKIMASPNARQIPQNDQFTIVNGRHVYLTAEGQRRANCRAASGDI